MKRDRLGLTEPLPTSRQRPGKSWFGVLALSASTSRGPTRRKSSDDRVSRQVGRLVVASYYREIA